MAHAQQLTTAPATQTKAKVTLTTESYPTGQAASPDKSQYTGNSTRSVMEWEGSGRWGVKLRLDQSPAHPVASKDVEAGAFYKVTPGFRVGGAVGLSDKPQPPQKNAQDDQVAPRVKLETTLKF
jgi:hypothetical protein